MRILMKMLKGERVIAGVIDADSKTERRFVFSAQLSEGDEKTFLACIRSIATAK
jgi:hypothetical protein